MSACEDCGPGYNIGDEGCRHEIVEPLGPRALALARKHVWEGFHHDMPEDEYHGHKGSLSHSGAKVLLKAPALFKWQQEHPVHRDVFDFGSAAHRLVLGVGAELDYIDAPDWRSKATQAWRDEVRERGAVPLLFKDYERVCQMAEALKSHRLAMRLLSDGEPEVSAFAADEETGVLRRGRFDWLGRTIITDYKSAASAEPQTFLRAAVNFGYHSQAAWYTDLARDLGHPAAAFAFIVQEKEAPYLPTVIELPAELVEVGRRRNRAALERFRDCTETDRWPGYVPDDQFATPYAPSWALREDIA